MVLTDQDGTNTVNSTEVNSNQEIADRASCAALMREHGVVTGTVTARTLGLTMSEEARIASAAHGFSELPPRWAKNQAGRHYYVDPAKVRYFANSLDRDVSACLGSGIALRNGKGYMIDQEYEHLLKYDRTLVSSTVGLVPWRQAVLKFLVERHPMIRDNLSPLEKGSNYQRGITNVAPLRYRIQLDYKGEAGLRRMRELQVVIEEGRTAGDRVAERIATVDESYPNRVNPEKSRYTLYLIPWGARKEQMINWLVERSAKAAALETKDIRLFYAGDTLTDLRAGLYGGGQASTVFLLATGSRVAPYILERESYFGNESLEFLWPSESRVFARFQPTGVKGMYTFSVSGGLKKPNLVVIGDERYPGMTPPGSVYAFLREFL